MSIDNSDPKLDILIELMKQSNKDFESIRESNHAIRDELNKVSGQFMLLRQSNDQEKEINLSRFSRVHERIDSEQLSRKDNEVEIKKKIEHIDSVLNIVAPKVNRMSTMTDWATRLVIGALVSGVLWATAQGFIDKN